MITFYSPFFNPPTVPTAGIKVFPRIDARVGPRCKLVHPLVDKWIFALLGAGCFQRLCPPRFLFQQVSTRLEHWLENGSGDTRRKPLTFHPRRGSFFLLYPSRYRVAFERCYFNPPSSFKSWLRGKLILHLFSKSFPIFSEVCRALFDRKSRLSFSGYACTEILREFPDRIGGSEWFSCFWNRDRVFRYRLRDRDPGVWRIKAKKRRWNASITLVTQ